MSILIPLNPLFDNATGTASSAVTPVVASLLTSNGSDTDGTVFTTASVSPTANRLVLLFTLNANNSSAANYAPTSVAGAGLTFTKLREDINSPNFSGASLWYACSASPSSGVITLTHSVTKGVCTWAVVEFECDADPADNGLSAILQCGAQYWNATTNIATVPGNFSAFDNVGNATFLIGSQTNNTAAYSSTPGSGMTELSDIDIPNSGGGWDNHVSTYWANTQQLGASYVNNVSAGGNALGTYSIEIKALSSGPAVLDAEAGSYVVTGSNAGLKWGRKIAAGTATYVYTGATAGLKWGHKVGAGTATYSISGQAAVLRATRKLAAATASYTLTGATANLRRSRFLTAGTASYTITGFATSLRRNSKLASGTASYVLTGSAADLDHDKRLVAGVGVYVYTGQPATLTHVTGDAFIAAGVGTYVLTGSVAGLRKTYRMVAGAGAYTTTFQPANLKTARKLAAGTSSYVITGSPAAMRRSYRLVLAPGTYTFSYQPAGLKHNTRLSAQSGSYAYTGSPATLTKTERDHHPTLVAEPGSYVFDYHDVVELVSSTPVYRRIFYGRYGRGNRLGTG